VATRDEPTARADELRSRALEVLCSPELAHMVEMVVFSPEPGVYEARAVDGSVTFTREGRTVGDGDRDGDGPDPAGGGPGDGWDYRVKSVTGRNPLGDQDPTRFSPLVEERANLQPDRRQNSYPLAFERIAQVWDHPCAPDLCVLHTAAHRISSHRGEHGSLDVVQSRAPLIASGAGIRAGGVVPGHCRLVDVAPTVLALLGVEPGPGIGAAGEPSDACYLARTDGRPLTELFDPSSPRPEHVVVVLMDGANANVLYAAAADGTMPNLHHLLESGTALAGGALASLPTVTLANHTTLNTGAHPGHHGVLHNAWYDRAAGRQVVTESPATWQESMQWLLPGVETVHEALHRRRPDAVSVAVNEPADRGADYSTMEVMRRGETSRLAESVPEGPPDATTEWMTASHEYFWGSMVDASAVQQAEAIWDGHLFGADYPAPAFMWVSFSLTDAAFHEGGPHSPIAEAAMRDTDARLGRVLAAVERAGAAGTTAFLVVADHGMEETAADVRGDWCDALRAAGVEHRDEASGFLYLGVAPDPAPGGGELSIEDLAGGAPADGSAAGG
jgi:hypothetical protein